MGQKLKICFEISTPLHEVMKYQLFSIGPFDIFVSIPKVRTLISFSDKHVLPILRKKKYLSTPHSKITKTFLNPSQ